MKEENIGVTWIRDGLGIDGRVDGSTNVKKMMERVAGLSLIHI